jgi:hypothetical protein
MIFSSSFQLPLNQMVKVESPFQPKFLHVCNILDQLHFVHCSLSINSDQSTKREQVIHVFLWNIDRVCYLVDPSRNFAVPLFVSTLF